MLDPKISWSWKIIISYFWLNYGNFHRKVTLSISLINLTDKGPKRQYTYLF